MSQNVSRAWYYSITNNERLKMNKYELRDLALSLATENHGTANYAALWGAASVLLSDEHLEIITRVMGQK